MPVKTSLTKKSRSRSPKEKTSTTLVAVNTSVAASISDQNSPNVSRDESSPLLGSQTSSKSGQPSQEVHRSKSPKSDSGSKRQPRLYRTLKRRPRARIIEEDDLKWVWAAYKKNSLNDTNGEAIFPDGLKPDEFNELFRKLLTRERITCWICTVKNQPVGLVMATNQIGMTLILTFCWFSWASKRNIIESAVNFINHFRGEMNMIGYVESYKDFFVHIAKHGIIRRAGTIELENKMAIYQSRK